jgi:uncharacterized ubiquitin-like protein YukD
MQNILLTIVGPYRQYDLELPGDVPVHDLLPLLVDICGPTHASTRDQEAVKWCLRVAESSRTLSGTLSLSDAGIFDGMVLHVQEVSTLKEERVPETGFRPRSLTPGPATGGIGIQWDRKGLS